MARRVSRGITIEGIATMGVEYWLGAVIAAALFACLVYVLIRPERF